MPEETKTEAPSPEQVAAAQAEQLELTQATLTHLQNRVVALRMAVDERDKVIADLTAELAKAPKRPADRRRPATKKAAAKS